MKTENYRDVQADLRSCREHCFKQIILEIKISRGEIHQKFKCFKNRFIRKKIQSLEFI